MILFIDFETTGLPDFNKRASDPSQPHIVEWAAISTDDDVENRERCHAIVKPDGWEIPEDSIASHGITNQEAEKSGIAENQVAAQVIGLIKDASIVVMESFRIPTMKHGNR